MPPLRRTVRAGPASTGMAISVSVRVRSPACVAATTLSRQDAAGDGAMPEMVDVTGRPVRSRYARDVY